MPTTKPPPLRRPIPAEDFPPLPRTKGGGTLRFKVHHVVAALVQQKVLHGGDYLPSEDKLADHWQIDRQTVHRGLQDLRADGYLNSAPGTGWYVPHGLSQEELEDQFEVYASPDDPQVLRVVVGEETILELNFRELEHGVNVGEVPATWRRMVIVNG